MSTARTVLSMLTPPGLDQSPRDSDRGDHCRDSHRGVHVTADRDGESETDDATACRP